VSEAKDPQASHVEAEDNSSGDAGNDAFVSKVVQYVIPESILP